MLWLLAACAAPQTQLVAPDPAADGLEGRDGPLGAVLVVTSVQARVVERLPVDLVVPADGTGPWPSVIMVQGGFVTPERYHWLAAHLATRGYAVVLPHHDLDLAITEVDDGVLAWRALVDHPVYADTFAGPVAAVGHSLGGVVAALSWAAHDDVDALGLFASYPAGDGPVTARPGSPVLVVAGSTDGSALPADVAGGFERLRDPAWYASIDGMNHYAWTDDASEADLEGDGPLGRPLDEVRADASWVVDVWLDHALRGAPIEWAFPETIGTTP
jgi:dienelactone hydrolase